jgi:hypothetical protein
LRVKVRIAVSVVGVVGVREEELVAASQAPTIIALGPDGEGEIDECAHAGAYRVIAVTGCADQSIGAEGGSRQVENDVAG